MGRVTTPLPELTPENWDGAGHTLADLLPAAAHALGIGDLAGTAGPDLPTCRRLVVFLVDGLGAGLLDDHAADAPTLHSLRGTPLRAGFPATTATSITSLTSGTECGVHGIVGYSFRPENTGRTLNALRWTLDTAMGPNALEVLPPEQIAPGPTVLEAMAAAGIDVHYVMPGEYTGSGLSRVAYRAVGTAHDATTPDTVRDGIRTALRSPGPTLVYAYYSVLDMMGHIHGPGSLEWIAELRRVDTLVADIATDLPADTALVVTGDHGMISAGTTIDIDSRPDLLASTSAVAGEARVRHVYTPVAATGDVLAAWTETLGEHAHVASRTEAIDRGWFHTPADSVIARRLGDVIAVARDSTVLIRSEAEPFESTMIGHHGSWTAAEQLVPLLVATRR